MFERAFDTNDARADAVAGERPDAQHRSATLLVFGFAVVAMLSILVLLVLARSDAPSDRRDRPDRSPSPTAVRQLEAD